MKDLFLQFLIGHGSLKAWHLWIHRHLIETLVKRELLCVRVRDRHSRSLIHKKREVRVAAVAWLVVWFVDRFKADNKEHCGIHFGRHSNLIFETEEGWARGWIVYTCKSTLALDWIAAINVHYSDKETREGGVIWEISCPVNIYVDAIPRQEILRFCPLFVKVRYKLLWYWPFICRLQRIIVWFLTHRLFRWSNREFNEGLQCLCCILLKEVNGWLVKVELERTKSQRAIRVIQLEDCVSEIFILTWTNGPSDWSVLRCNKENLKQQVSIVFHSMIS